MRKMGFTEDEIERSLNEMFPKSDVVLESASSLSKLAELQSNLESPKQAVPIYEVTREAIYEVTQEVPLSLKDITISQQIQSRREFLSSYRNPSCWNR